MYFLAIPLIYLLVPLILGFMVFRARSMNFSSRNTLKYPRFLTWFFLVAMIVIALVIVVLFIGVGGVVGIGGGLPDEEPHWSYYVIMIPLYTLFWGAIAYEFLNTLNFRLVLEDERIVYKNLWGVVKVKKYEEVSRVKVYRDKGENLIKYKIYFGKRAIVIDHFMENFTEFPRLMKKGLKKAKNKISFLDEACRKGAKH